MNTLKFCGTNMSPEMKQLVEKAKNEFANVQISVEPCAEQEGTYKNNYVAIANDTVITADTTHLLFERIKNIIGEREVAVPNSTRYEK